MLSSPLKAARFLGRSAARATGSVSARRFTEQRTTAGKVRVVNKLDLNDPALHERHEMFQVWTVKMMYSI
jgi:hypothetical protein